MKFNLLCAIQLKNSTWKLGMQSTFGIPGIYAIKQIVDLVFQYKLYLTKEDKCENIVEKIRTSYIVSL